MRPARGDASRSSKEHASPSTIGANTKLVLAASAVMLLAAVGILYAPSGGSGSAAPDSAAAQGASLRAAGQHTECPAPRPCPSTEPSAPAPAASVDTPRAGSALCKSGKTLDQIGIEKGTDKRSTFHGFLHHYDRLFARDLCEQETVKILELGFLYGASIATWADYYGAGTIVGVDHLYKQPAKDAVSKAKAANPNARIEIIILDLNKNIADLDQKLEGLGPFDVIVDDANHRYDQQFLILRHMLKHVKPGGWYVCEDLHTSVTGEVNFYGGNNYERPLDMFTALQNPEGGIFKPNSLFSEEDFQATRAKAEEVVVYYHRTAKPEVQEGVTYQPFTSVTAGIRVRQ